MIFRNQWKTAGVEENIFLLLNVIILIRYKSGFICMPFCPCLIASSNGLPAERRNTGISYVGKADSNMIDGIDPAWVKWQRGTSWMHRDDIDKETGDSGVYSSSM